MWSKNGIMWKLQGMQMILIIQTLKGFLLGPIGIHFSSLTKLWKNLFVKTLEGQKLKRWIITIKKRSRSQSLKCHVFHQNLLFVRMHEMCNKTS